MYKKEHYLMAALAFFFVLVFYVLTMAPTVTFWDAGEFIAASYCLGVPHPPGTPLFVLIGRLVATLPLPLEIAARLNLVSILSGSLSAMLIFLIAVKILEPMVADTGKPGARLVINGGAFVCAIIPPFLYTVWSNSTEFEVYSIATTTILFCGWLMIYMGSLKDPRRIKNVLLLVIYIVSLSFANHLIVLLVSPAVIIYTLLHDRANWKYWCSILGSFLGLYLLVTKGLDLTSVAERLSGKNFAEGGLLVSSYRLVAGVLDIIFGITNYVGNWNSFLFGLLIAVCFIFWAYKRKALGFFGVALGLFLLGFSIHLYLLIRAGLNPPINEGQPETLKAFWAVIGREQYGSAYGLLPRQAWQLIAAEKMKLAGLGSVNAFSIGINSLTDLIENIRVYFQYNITFYTKYFGWQYSSTGWTVIFLALGIYGAVEHARYEKKSFFFWLTVFLVTGLILNTYMNFKLGYTQALDKYPGLGLHEVRERDYFFIVSFAFFGVWSGLGLAAVLNRLRIAFAVDSANPKLKMSAFGFLGAIVLLPGLLPLILNYKLVDRSGNYITPNYARNVMNSLEPDGILFTNGDNDTFPLWYIQEVEGVRKDCRVVNLSLLNTKWYIKQMKDMEPRVPISLSDEAIDKLQPRFLPRKQKFLFGEVDLTFPDSSVVYVKDFVILDILRTNNWRKPIYFTTTTPTHNRCHLDPYLVQFGAVYKINPRRGETMARKDSMNLYPIGDQGIHFDAAGSARLLNEVYRYDTFFRDIENQGEDERRATAPFCYAYSILGQIYLRQNRLSEAVDSNFMVRQFKPDRHRYNLTMANLYARSRRYEQAYAFMDSLVHFTGDSSPHLFMEMAQIAIDSDSTAAAVNFMEQAIDFFPGYKDSYANLFMVHNATDNKQAAIAVVEKYLQRFPEDNKVIEELNRYRETGELNLQKAFQIPSP